MNPIIWAAIISGGWAAVVAAIGYRFNRATAKATVQATNANTQAALDAAHAAQLWEKKAEAYADIIALISRRQAARSDLMRMLRYDEDTEEQLRQATEPPPGTDWAKIRARLTAFAARPVVDAMNATMDADNEVRARWGQHKALAEQGNASAPGGPTGDQMRAALKAAQDAATAADVADETLEDLIYDDLVLKPSDRAALSRLRPGQPGRLPPDQPSDAACGRGG